MGIGYSIRMKSVHLACWSLLLILSGCAHFGRRSAPIPGSESAPTFTVAHAGLATPLVFVTYGDMRFTDPGVTGVTSPPVRRALIERVLWEHPAALFLNGDLPLRGLSEDYAVFAQETAAWRRAALPVYPALGNHEFSQCQESVCLERWWSTFPQLRPRRWYSVAVGDRLLAVALDTDTSLLPGSPQRHWLDAQLGALDSHVRLVMIFLHHPPVADQQPDPQVSHNVRPNEAALADYLRQRAPRLRARVLVVAGHVHNYERFSQDGVTYLVSGGGGAAPVRVQREAADQYQSQDFPNYHYLRFELRADRLLAQMIRLEDSRAAKPSHWQVRDQFELALVH